jgi:hypothetical protein
MRDPLFRQDLADVERDFRFADAEIVTPDGPMDAFAKLSELWRTRWARRLDEINEW